MWIEPLDNDDEVDRGGGGEVLAENEDGVGEVLGDYVEQRRQEMALSSFVEGPGATGRERVSVMKYEWARTTGGLASAEPRRTRRQRRPGTGDGRGGDGTRIEEEPTAWVEPLDPGARFYRTKEGSWIFLGAQ